MDATIVFNQMVTLLLMLVVGVVVAKTGVVDEDTNRRLSRFALLVPQCAIILSSAINMELEMSLGKVLTLLALACGMYVILVIVGFLLPRVCRLKKEVWGIYTFMTIFGNVTFMGFPLIRGVYGSDAVLYAALLGVPFNLMAFTLGVSLITGEKMSFDWRKMINAPLVSSVLAVVFIFLPINWPGPVRSAMSYLGDMIVPLSMIIIGASLGNQRLRDVFGDWRAYAYAPVRLILVPVLLWAVMRMFISDPTILGILTMLGATPCATIAAMYSIQYGRNVEIAVRTVFVTTVLSVVTIPLVCGILL